MGARPDTFKSGGGGFLNDVDGTIVGYRFTDEFNGEAFVPGKKPGTKEDKFHRLNMELTVRLDGADEDITQTLGLGAYDNYEVSDDELTLTSSAGEDEECSIPASWATAQFIASLCEAGFAQSKFSEDPNSINFEPMNGLRVRFGQKVVLDKQGNASKRKVKKGKFAGREFDNTTTIVKQVYPADAKAGKAGKTEKAGKSGKKDKDEDEGADVETLATKFILKVVAANKGKLAKAKLSMALLKEENGLSKHPEREAIRKLLKSDEFLENENGWGYDAKKEIITVEED